MTSLSSIREKQKEAKRLTGKLAMSCWLEDNFPGIQWPAHTAVVRRENTFLFRVRDNTGKVMVFDFKDIPIYTIKAQQNIMSLYTTNMDFKRHIDWRR